MQELIEAVEALLPKLDDQDFDGASEFDVLVEKLRDALRRAKQPCQLAPSVGPGVCVVRIWHRHGADIHVTADEVLALDEVFLYAKENWPGAFGKPFPEPPENSMLDENAVIRDYFAKREDEGYEIINVDVEGWPVANRWVIYNHDDDSMISRVYDDYQECVGDANEVDNSLMIAVAV